MTRVAYANGKYVNQADATTSIEDRGYVFADGVYEYIAFYNRRFLDLDAHLKRLERSLGKLHIAAPMGLPAMKLVIQELMDRNVRTDGAVYLQITRGIARREHGFPKNVKPVLTMTIGAAKTPKEAEMKSGAVCISAPDERWKHCDIKSISLLGNIIAKQKAVEAGARETWLTLPDGTVTEGSACNVYIVTKQDGIITHPADNHVLPGITRDIVLNLARKNGIRVSERPFNIQEAYAADEAFLTSTSPNVLAVVQLDGKKIGSGAPGPVVKKLNALYAEHILKQTGKQFPTL